MKLRMLLPALLLALPLAACGGRDHDAPAADAHPDTTLGKTVRAATDQARKALLEGNLALNASGQPKAEITPDGHLLISGKEVTTTAEQRAQLLAYRQQIQAVAEAGMQIGVAGANLGTRAAGEAIRGVFSGNTADIEARVNAEADKLKAEATRLCKRMPALMASQQAIAATLPAFAPYATMDQSDIDSCDA